jgi:hypothetical protein
MNVITLISLLLSTVLIKELSYKPACHRGDAEQAGFSKTSANPDTSCRDHPTFYSFMNVITLISLLLSTVLIKELSYKPACHRGDAEQAGFSKTSANPDTSCRDHPTFYSFMNVITLISLLLSTVLIKELSYKPACHRGDAEQAGFSKTSTNPDTSCRGHPTLIPVIRTSLGPYCFLSLGTNRLTPSFGRTANISPFFSLDNPFHHLTKVKVSIRPF